MIGNRPVMVDVKVTYDDGTEEVIKETPAVWKDGKRELILNTKLDSKIISVELLNEKIPDANPENDSVEF
ncbi:hypothetical protein BMS3Abin03_01475 [bacterium BMS3Abin03]|nr:hypothetical protein BMS3Abin03_01475 [bacterium BMS3Abin03]